MVVMRHAQPGYILGKEHNGTCIFYKKRIQTVIRKKLPSIQKTEKNLKYLHQSTCSTTNFKYLSNSILNFLYI